MKNIMIDLETMGDGPEAAIISIGAVKFGPSGLGGEFYQVVSLEDSVANGGVITTSTIEWWMNQSDDAKAEWVGKGVGIKEALSSFSDWIGGEEFDIWGNGASFDNVILASAYRNNAMKCPWNFWNDRCYRTIKALHPDVKAERLGTHHNALDDAKTQALHLIKILSK